MKIVVLDGYTLNPGDLSWAELESLGRCEVYDRTPVAQIPQRAADAQIILTNKAVLSKETIVITSYSIHYTKLYDLVTFQELILSLQNYWARQGCIIQQPYDVEKGAGTFNPATFLP